ncbi:unnamed protein product, partial [marine sediment metagenome]
MAYRFFGQEDVHVTVPLNYITDPQGIRRTVKIYKKGMKKDKRMKRVVINFYVCYKDGHGNRVPITNFGPKGMILEVGYNQAESD